MTGVTADCAIQYSVSTKREPSPLGATTMTSLFQTQNIPIENFYNQNQIIRVASELYAISGTSDSMTKTYKRIMGLSRASDSPVYELGVIVHEGSIFRALKGTPDFRICVSEGESSVFELKTLSEVYDLFCRGKALHVIFAHRSKDSPCKICRIGSIEYKPESVRVFSLFLEGRSLFFAGGVLSQALTEPEAR